MGKYNPRKTNQIRATSFRFGHNLFENIRVLGQVDKKFIAAIGENVRTNDSNEANNVLNVLLLFDQHAVHERIRLENLIRGQFT